MLHTADEGFYFYFIDDKDIIYTGKTLFIHNFLENII